MSDSNDSGANANDLMSLCKRRGFIWPSFEIYGGVAGMYDYGPLGCSLRNNIVDVWRAIYKGREGFIEIDSETVNPREVFKASGMPFCTGRVSSTPAYPSSAGHRE